MLVVAGRRVFLKVCFQVLTVLSSTDSVGACRAHEGAWSGAKFMVSRVKIFRSSLLMIYLVVRPWTLASHLYRFSASVEWTTARTAFMSGDQSSVSVEALPPSRRERSSSPVHTLKISRYSIHLIQRKIKCSLNSTASPHSQRLVSTALMLRR